LTASSTVLRATVFLSGVALALTGCVKNADQSHSISDQQNVDYPEFARVLNTAGATTSPDAYSSFAFNVPTPGMTDEENELHLKGDFEFNRQFNTEGGVGPAFNANSCIACHARDGRGALPILAAGESKVKLGANESLLLRISLEPEGQPPMLVPGFAEQLYHRGIYSLRPDSPGTGQADVEMSFEFSTFTYPDGRTVELRKPIFTITNAYDAIDGKPSQLANPDLRVSPRIGPPMIGLGLLEAIDARDILALADPDDRDGDGISGRANFIGGKLGRFGWKANTTSIREQVAGALSNDMGLRNSVFPLENINGTSLFTSLIERLGELWKPLETEIKEDTLHALEFYSATLAVPARRDIDNPRVLRGAKTFETIGCTSCHAPKFRTSDRAASPALRGIEIYPFSDGLLHDMGEELADNRRDHEADGREWKTRPLWGIGLTQTINPRAGFLHDGRARTLEEAILYHGGEAAEIRSRFVHLDASKRAELLAFLSSL
jgi:CxxC motif-containing protein (DUF1111 family)